jgi:hypothetical protein
MNNELLNPQLVVETTMAYPINSELKASASTGGSEESIA